MNITNNWIQARIPVDTNWRTFLLEDVEPFLASAVRTGAIERWFHALHFSHGLVLTVYIQAEVTAVHNVLLPSLRDKFQEKNSTPLAGDDQKDLLAPIKQLVVSRVNLPEPEAILHFRSTSSQLYTFHKNVRKPGLRTVYSEIYAALAASGMDDAEICLFTCKSYQHWLNNYLGGRYTVLQIAERCEQERQLTAFLRERPRIDPKSLLHEFRRPWIEAVRAVSSKKADLAACLNAHIELYALDHFEIGQLWVNLYQGASAFATQGNCFLATTESNSAA